MGMMGRWLVKETWKPVSGSPITVFSAATSANSMPDDGSWEVETCAKRGHVKGQVIGFAQVRSNSYLGHHDSLNDLIDVVEDAGRIIHWEDGCEPSETEDDPEGADEDEVAQNPDDGAQMGVDICVHCEQEIDGGWCPDCDSEDDQSSLSDLEQDAKQLEMEMEDDEDDDEDDDVVREPDPTGQPKTLTFSPDPDYEPDDDKHRRNGTVVAEPTGKRYSGDAVYDLKDRADESDIRGEVVYRGVVNGVEHYGVFVSLTTPVDRSDVSGLVHKSQLPLARDPADYQAGDTAYVELIKHTNKGPKFNMIDDEVER